MVSSFLLRYNTNLKSASRSGRFLHLSKSTDRSSTSHYYTWYMLEIVLFLVFPTIGFMSLKSWSLRGNPATTEQLWFQWTEFWEWAMAIWGSSCHWMEKREKEATEVAEMIDHNYRGELVGCYTVGRRRSMCISWKIYFSTFEWTHVSNEVVRTTIRKHFWECRSFQNRIIRKKVLKEGNARDYSVNILESIMKYLYRS